MSWELAPGEIEALDWALELDRRGHASTIPDAMRRAVEWGDLAGMCRQLGYDGAPGVEGGRSSGLV